MMLDSGTRDVSGECRGIRMPGAGVVADPYYPTEHPKGTIATVADPEPGCFRHVTPMELR
jgi:hypothetical protein